VACDLVPLVHRGKDTSVFAKFYIHPDVSSCTVNRAGTRMAAGSGGDAGARPQLLSSFLESTFPPCSAVLKIKSISLHAAQKRPALEGGVFVCERERERERA